MVNVDLKDYETYSHINEDGFINVQPAYAVYVSGGYVKFSLRLPKIPATISINFISNLRLSA